MEIKKASLEEGFELHCIDVTYPYLEALYKISHVTY